MESIPYGEDLLAVARTMQKFPRSYVLVGGAAIPFLLTDPLISARPTLDIDIVVRITTRGEYYKIEEWLRNHGFTSVEEGPICRWKLDQHLIDVMPTTGEVLGFSNRWYEAALETATVHDLTDEISIPVITPSPFIAAKLDAFQNRGEADYYASPDLEDVITVIDGRPEIVDEMSEAPPQLHTYVARTLKRWLESADFRNALPGHLQYEATSRDRALIIETRMRQIIHPSGLESNTGSG